MIHSDTTVLVEVATNEDLYMYVPKFQQQRRRLSYPVLLRSSLVGNLWALNYKELSALRPRARKL